MPRIRIKRAANKVPATTDVLSGELALNEATNALYLGVGGNTSASASVVEVNAVRSVASKTGAVSLVIGDIASLQTTLDAKIASSEKGANSGVATLDAGGKLPTTQLPNLAIVDYLGSVASQAAMLALVGQKGDWAIRSDSGAVWIITGSDPSIIGGWTQLSYPAAPVTSVASKTGAVSLVVGDVSGAAPLASPALTGTPTAPTAATTDNSTTLATTAFVKAQNYVTSSGVTNVATGTGLSGGPITSTGTISLANTAVTAGSYGSATSVATFTVDAQGRLTSASSTTIAGLGAGVITSGTIDEARLPVIDGGTF